MVKEWRAALLLLVFAPNSAIAQSDFGVPQGPAEDDCGRNPDACGEVIIITGQLPVDPFPGRMPADPAPPPCGGLLDGLDSLGGDPQPCPDQPPPKKKKKKKRKPKPDCGDLFDEEVARCEQADSEYFDTCVKASYNSAEGKCTGNATAGRHDQYPGVGNVYGVDGPYPVGEACFDVYEDREHRSPDGGIFRVSLPKPHGHLRDEVAKIDTHTGKDCFDPDSCIGGWFFGTDDVRRTERSDRGKRVSGTIGFDIGLWGTGSKGQTSKEKTNGSSRSEEVTFDGATGMYRACIDGHKDFMSECVAEAVDKVSRKEDRRQCTRTN